jgi:hypothetical protein
MNAFKFGHLLQKRAADPMAAINAKRVADMQAMAAKVRAASGTPNAQNNGTHQWSGRVMPGGAVQGAQYKGPTPPAPAAAAPAPTPRPRSSMISTPRTQAPAKPANTNMPAYPNAYTKPNVTSTPVNGAALAKQVKQMQQQPAAPQTPPPGASSASSWANQTNNQPGAISAPMSSVSTAFNNATGQQDPPHIITTDNGRKFNTQTKTFLDGRPGGFAL